MLLSCEKLARSGAPICSALKRLLRLHLLDFFDDFLGSSDRSKGRRAAKGKPAKRSRKERRVDAILDKVSREGMHALSEAERKILAQASEEKRR